MSNNILGQVLGTVFGNAMRGRQSGGIGGASGGLGDVLGGMLGRGGRVPVGRGSPFGGGSGALIGMLLPLAMQWVQRNGGVGEVLRRMQQKGYSQQAASWVSTGPNQALDARAIDDVVGTDELSRLSQQLDVPREEVAQGFAQIFPEMVDQLTPQGELPPDADGVLDDGLAQLQGVMRDLQLR